MKYDSSKTQRSRLTVPAPIRDLNRQGHLVGYKYFFDIGAGNINTIRLTRSYILSETNMSYFFHEPSLSRETIIKELGFYGLASTQIQNWTTVYPYAGFVLNVLDRDAREEFIDGIMSYYGDFFCAVRTDKVNGELYSDGVITKRGTFQKQFKKKDCDELGETILTGSNYKVIHVV